MPESLADSSRDIPENISTDLGSRGLSARSRHPQDDVSIRSAEDLIELVPSLACEVLRLVKALFILNIADPCFDQSHSEPAYPGIILVSVPPMNGVGALRLAEGIVHEAMHLNLSQLEQVVPLVAGEASLYSPWRQAERPALGVLHGAYVFACLHRFFELASEFLQGAPAMHANKRQEEIKLEAADLDWADLETQLTPSGATLLREIRLASGC